MYSVMTFGMLIGTYGSYMLFEDTSSINYGALVWYVAYSASRKYSLNSRNCLGFSFC